MTIQNKYDKLEEKVKKFKDDLINKVDNDTPLFLKIGDLNNEKDKLYNFILISIDNLNIELEYEKDKLSFWGNIFKGKFGIGKEEINNIKNLKIKQEDLLSKNERLNRFEQELNDFIEKG